MSNYTESRYNQYQSYLLRIWREGEGEWRAVLLSIPSQERRHFPNLPALFDYLQASAGAEPLNASAVDDVRLEVKR